MASHLVRLVPRQNPDLLAKLRQSDPSGPLAELRELGRTICYRADNGDIREMCEILREVEAIDPAADAWDGASLIAGLEGRKASGEIVASDETVDRYRDVIVAAGWKLENYVRNPVMLIDHSYRVESIVGLGEPRIVGKKLKLRFYDDEDEQNKNAAMVRRLRAARLLRAVSVGFMPLKWEKILEKNSDGEQIWKGGIRYLEQELLEASWVAVPANPSAVMDAEPVAVLADAEAELRGSDVTSYLATALEGLAFHVTPRAQP